MFTSFLLSLREGLEASLVIGIVLGALRRLGRTDGARAAWAGVAAAAVVSGAAAVLLARLGWSLHGRAEQIFEAFTALAAAGLLTWMVVWLGRQGPRLRADIESDVRGAVNAAGQRAVFWLTLVAVGREGLELALFLVAAASDSTRAPLLGGAALGLAAAAALGWALFASTVRLDVRRVFAVSGGLLLAMAAGLVAKGVHELNELGWLPALVDPIWNTRALLSERSLTGTFLKSVFGYTGAPSLTVAAAYFAYVATVGVMLLRHARPGADTRMAPRAQVSSATQRAAMIPPQP